MPKIVDHDQYRKELLSKCFDLFAEKGYASITMRQIAQGLEVSTGTLYHYFPNKKALFEQLVKEISQQDLLMALAELEGAQTLQERLESFGKFLTKNEDYLIKQTCIWVNFYQHQDSNKLWKSAAIERINEQHKQAVREFFNIQDSVLVSFVLSLTNGLILERIWGNETIFYAEQCALLGKMLTAYFEQRLSK